MLCTLFKCERNKSATVLFGRYLHRSTITAQSESLINTLSINSLQSGSGIPIEEKETERKCKLN